MTPFRQAKEDILAHLRAAAGPEATLLADHLEEPPNPEFGDVAFGCFPFAKVFGKNPAVVANDLANAIRKRLAEGKGGFVVGVEARGPYVNFRLDASALGTAVLAATKSAGVRYGTRAGDGVAARLPAIDTFLETRIENIRNIVPGRKIARQVSRFARGTASAVRKGASRVSNVAPQAPLVMVEVCSPNTHKEVHIGHLRNIYLGRAIVFLRRALGEEVVTASYPGDAGAHVAKTLWALETFHKGETPPKEKGRYLGKIYSEATAALEKNPQAKGEVENVQRLLEAGDRRWTALWRKTRAWSLAEIKAVFSELGVPIRRYYFESDMEGPGKRFVAELLKKGIATKSQGATIIDLDAEGLGAFLILKTDGTSLYATKDLALAKTKYDEYPLDLSIHVVDARQSLYFRQLAAALPRIGFTKPVVHVPFEFVTLKEGAMSSRKGNVIAYEDFRDEMIAKARGETSRRHKDWPKKKIEETARSIALGAMAVGMLKADTDRQIVFDMEEALSFDGFTGPYLQYTRARVGGLLAKGGRGAGRRGTYPYAAPEERQLVLDIARYPEVVEDAAIRYRPARLVAFLFDMAKHFAEFYERVPVLKAAPAERAARLALARSVGTVLESGFHILGIPVVREM